MSFASKLLNLIRKGNNKMGTSFEDLTSVINNLIGGYKEASWLDLGIGTSFDVKKICEENDIDYTTLSEDNFVTLKSSNTSTSGEYGTGSHWGNVNWVKSYNNETGVLTWYYRLSVANTRGDAIGDVHAYILLAKEAGKQQFVACGYTYNSRNNSKAVPISTYNSDVVDINGNTLTFKRDCRVKLVGGHSSVGASGPNGGNAFTSYGGTQSATFTNGFNGYNAGDYKTSKELEYKAGDTFSFSSGQNAYGDYYSAFVAYFTLYIIQ